MIGGLIIGGERNGGCAYLAARHRSSLAAGGVAGALQDPVMELRNANGEVVRENDNWQDNQPADIDATTIPPGDPA